MKTPLYVSVSDWVTVSGDSENHVRRQIAAGTLPAVRDGKKVQIDYEAALKRKRDLPSAAAAGQRDVGR